MAFFDVLTWEGNKPRSNLPKCGQCGLYKHCLSPKMPPTGAGKHRILFVGESPGEHEDKKGEQFVGPAGKYLRRVVSSLGMDLDDCWKTNAAICHPEYNATTSLHIDSCQPNIAATIERLKPNVIVLLGQMAVQSVIGSEWKDDEGGGVGEIGRWVGWTIPSVRYNAWLCPTYHPSFILREKEPPVLMKIFRKHLKKAIRLENVTPTGIQRKDLEKEIEVISDFGAFRRRLHDLSKKTGRLSFDYECTGLKPEPPDQKIVSCAFTHNHTDTFVGPIDPDLYKELSAVLRNPDLEKVASNLKFEERWTLVKLGHGVVNWKWDTMLGAHVLDNRRHITSVKFQAYIRLGITDWSKPVKKYMKARDANAQNRMADMPSLLYNGLDALIEDKVDAHQTEEMKRWL